MDAIPDALVSKKNEARMEIDLFNGSKLVLAGSNNYDGLMGTNPEIGRASCRERV